MSERERDRAAARHGNAVRISQEDLNLLYGRHPLGDFLFDCRQNENCIIPCKKSGGGQGLGEGVAGCADVEREGRGGVLLTEPFGAQENMAHDVRLGFGDHGRELIGCRQILLPIRATVCTVCADGKHEFRRGGVGNFTVCPHDSAVGGVHTVAVDIKNETDRRVGGAVFGNEGLCIACFLGGVDHADAACTQHIGYGFTYGEDVFGVVAIFKIKGGADSILAVGCITFGDVRMEDQNDRRAFACVEFEFVIGKSTFIYAIGGVVVDGGFVL